MTVNSECYISMITQIIEPYNSSVGYNLASHTTYVACINFIKFETYKIIEFEMMSNHMRSKSITM